MSTQGSVGAAPEAGFEPIEVQMLVTPPDDSACPSLEGITATVKQSFHMDAGGHLPCQMVLSSDDGVEYRQNDACENCPCFLMQTHNCITLLQEIRDGRLLYSVTLLDRLGLPPLIASLREAGATVTVTRILTAGEDEDAPPALTDKQRETLLVAIEAGYYDRPRQATLDDVASELDISMSAASQRLNSVKRRLIDKYVEQFEAGTSY